MDSLINILLCVLGYLPGLIHSWYIIAKYPPYTVNHELKIYYLYQNSSDLERQQPRDCHHHHHHTHVNSEPAPVAGPTYGATSEGTEGSSAGAVAPPPYTELPQK